MKKLLFLSTLVLCLTSMQAFAGKGELFDVDDAAIEQQFSDLNQLEQYVENHDDLTWTEMQENHTDFLATAEITDLTLSRPLGTAWTIDDMDWGAFAWGFCCCPIGFFVVAVNSNKDANQKTSFWIGVAVSTILSAISSAFSTASTL